MKYKVFIAFVLIASFLSFVPSAKATVSCDIDSAKWGCELLICDGLSNSPTFAECLINLGCSDYQVQTNSYSCTLNFDIDDPAALDPAPATSVPAPAQTSPGSSQTLPPPSFSGGSTSIPATGSDGSSGDSGNTGGNLRQIKAEVDVSTIPIPSGGAGSNNGSSGPVVTGDTGKRGLVPSCKNITNTFTQSDGKERTVQYEKCEIGNLIGSKDSLLSNFINFLLIYLAIPLATLSIAIAGFKFILSGSNPSQRESAKNIFWFAFIGLVIAFAAWLIVDTILKALVDDKVITSPLEQTK